MKEKQGRVLPIGGPPSGVSSLCVLNYNRLAHECHWKNRIAQRNHTLNFLFQNNNYKEYNSIPFKALNVDKESLEIKESIS